MSYSGPSTQSLKPKDKQDRQPFKPVLLSSNSPFKIAKGIIWGFPTRMVYLALYVLVEIHHSGWKPLICCKCLNLFCTYQRSLHGHAIVGVSHCPVHSHGFGLLHKLVIDGFLHKRPGPSTAVLSMIVHDGSMGPRHCFLHWVGCWGGWD